MGASGEYGGTGPPEQAGPFGPGTPAYVELQVQGTSLTYPCQRSGAESTDQRADQAALQAAGRAGIDGPSGRQTWRGGWPAPPSGAMQSAFRGRGVIEIRSAPILF